jgi:hypothetical protein
MQGGWALKHGPFFAEIVRPPEKDVGGHRVCLHHFQQHLVPDASKRTGSPKVPMLPLIVQPTNVAG